MNLIAVNLLPEACDIAGLECCNFSWMAHNAYPQEATAESVAQAFSNAPTHPAKWLAIDDEPNGEPPLYCSERVTAVDHRSRLISTAMQAKQLGNVGIYDSIGSPMIYVKGEPERWEAWLDDARFAAPAHEHCDFIGPCLYWQPGEQGTIDNWIASTFKGYTYAASLCQSPPEVVAFVSHREKGDGRPLALKEFRSHNRRIDAAGFKHKCLWHHPMFSEFGDKPRRYAAELQPYLDIYRGCAK